MKCYWKQAEHENGNVSVSEDKASVDDEVDHEPEQANSLLPHGGDDGEPHEEPHVDDGEDAPHRQGRSNLSTYSRRSIHHQQP